MKCNCDKRNCFCKLYLIKNEKMIEIEITYLQYTYYSNKLRCVFLKLSFILPRDQNTVCSNTLISSSWLTSLLLKKSFTLSIVCCSRRIKKIGL